MSNWRGFLVACAVVLVMLRIKSSEREEARTVTSKGEALGVIAGSRQPGIPEPQQSSLISFGLLRQAAHA
jgi:hypothetical protein